MMSETMCTIRSLTKRYSSTVAVDRIDLDLCQNELVSVIGPSGAGKTTLLRLIAGLESVDDGTIEFAASSTGQNPAVLVFQDFLLFPTMSVSRNIGFGLRARGLKRREIDERVQHLLEVFGLVDKADSYPGLLSAGQQQRVAIARALAVRPKLLLLDEPFGHLDKTLRMDTALYLRAKMREFGITTVAVTHNLDEAFAMSDRIGVMIAGRLVQVDTVEQVYSHPATFEVARFLGPVNRFPAALLDNIECDDPTDTRSAQDRVFCRAESVSIFEDAAGPGTVTDVVFLGVMVLYRVKVRLEDEEIELSALGLENGIAPGSRVQVRLSHILSEGAHR